MFDALTVLHVEAASRAVLAWLVLALLLGSILAVVTWILVRALSRRISPALEVALWSIVLLRFVIPGGPGWPGSLAHFCGTVIPPAPRAAPAPEGLPAPALLQDSTAGTLDARAADPTPCWPGWATLSVTAYAAALLSLGTLRTVSYWRFRVRCLALPPADPDTLRIVHEVCDRLGVRRTPLIRISVDERAPFVMGIIHPVLVLAGRQLVRPDELETVIVHEVTHLRRGDMLVRCVQCLAGVLFFFWPVVAWVNRRIDQAREYACDERALRRGKLTPGQYARCLLEAARWRPPRWTFAPACMAGHPSTIERRIDVILTLPGHRPQGVLGRLGVAVFLAAWCGFSLAGADEAKSKQKYEPTEQGMRQHADALFARIGKLPGGDVNGDGTVTKEECWAYVAAVILSQPDAVLAEYPWADESHDGKLEPKEALLFGRGDYDFRELHEKYAPEKKKVTTADDKQKQIAFKQKLATAEYETWHEILDRRAHLIDSAKKLPTAEFVRQVSKQQMQEVILPGELAQNTEGVTKLTQLKQEAKDLRTKAGTATGEKKAKYEAKAAELEQHAAERTGQLRAIITARLADLDTQGATEEAARWRDLLKKIETL